jgi:hypothetical protein
MTVSQDAEKHAVRVCFRGASLFRRPVRTRFPFRFGKASMTEMPVVYVRSEWEREGGRPFEGVSASGIPPLWFDKRDGKTAAGNERDLLASLSAAMEAYHAAGFGSAWDLHCAVTPSVRAALSAQGQAPLAAGFGPALLEAACVDGLCRSTGLSFFAALKGGAFGVPGDILDALPEKPTGRMALRHTVGLADALYASEVTEPLRDGLPESLEEVVEFYRPRYFKVKISADAAETLPRLARMAEILKKAGDYAVTLDGNEQFATMDAFAAFLDAARAEPALADFWNRVLWIEQPVRRDAALDPSCAAALGRVSAFRPVILDESDGEEDALERGLALGYAGVSSKTCKGLFRSLSHKARLRGVPGAILSCEDLTTVPAHPLQQDLCLAAALGLSNAERNGHHYIMPSGFLSPVEQRGLLEEYPSLYSADASGSLRVRIADGGFDLSEANAARAFGVSVDPDWDALERIT